jgi:ACR3 family arsenite efflux pump ArsB
MMKALTVIAWAAPFLAAPLYFFALVGWGMSATSSPHANAGELLMLVIAPCVSLVAIVKIFAAGKIKPLKAVGLFVPGLLSVAELAFTLLICRAG